MKCKHGCGKESAKNRRECNKCKSANWRKKNPILAIWFEIKRSAKRRNLDFNLEYNWFSDFVNNSPLLEIRGRSAESYSIDRKENDKGYIMGNLQVISKSENSKKYHELFRQLTKGTILEESDKDAPF